MALNVVGAYYQGAGGPSAVAGQVGDRYKDTNVQGAEYLCVASGNPGTWQLVASGTALQVTSNLGDLNNATTARSNLGLGTAAVKAASGSSSTVASVTGATVVGHVASFADTAGTIQDGGVAPGGLTYIGVGSGIVTNLDYTTINTGLPLLVPVNASYNYIVTEILFYVNSAITGNNIRISLTDNAGPVIANVDAAGLTTGAYIYLSELVNAGNATLGAQWWSPFTNLPVVLSPTPFILTGGNINVQVLFAAVPI